MMQTRFCRTQIPRTLECVVLEYSIKNTLRTLQTILKIVLSAFQIVKELITSNEVTIFKSTHRMRLKMVGDTGLEPVTPCL